MACKEKMCSAASNRVSRTILAQWPTWNPTGHDGGSNPMTINFLDTNFARSLTSITNQFVQLFISMRWGRWDGAGIRMPVAVGLGVWVHEIELKPVVGGSKLIKNGWGRKVDISCVKEIGKKKVVDKTAPLRCSKNYSRDEDGGSFQKIVGPESGPWSS